MKTLVCAVASVSASFAANATTTSGEVFETQITFDRAKLASVETAAEVLEAIEAQARAACEVTRFDETYVDRTCVKDLVEKVVEEVSEETLTLAYLS